MPRRAWVICAPCHMWWLNSHAAVVFAAEGSRASLGSTRNGKGAWIRDGRNADDRHVRAATWSGRYGSPKRQALGDGWPLRRRCRSILRSGPSRGNDIEWKCGVTERKPQRIFASEIGFFRSCGVL